MNALRHFQRIGLGSCAENCGQCGGAGCGAIPGTAGPDACCSTSIAANGTSCQNAGAAPCIITDWVNTPAPVVIGSAAPVGKWCLPPAFFLVVLSQSPGNLHNYSFRFCYLSFLFCFFSFFVVFYPVPRSFFCSFLKMDRCSVNAASLAGNTCLCVCVCFSCALRFVSWFVFVLLFCFVFNVALV